MTASAEGPADLERAEVPFGAPWRAKRAREQEAVLPVGSLTLCCSASLGSGGLGRHAQEIADAHERHMREIADARGRDEQEIADAHGRDGGELRCVCGQEPGAALPGGPGARALALLTRRSAAWRMWSSSVSFDTAAARGLPRS